MKKILLTGSAGKIGTSLRQELDRFYQFRCFDRQPIDKIEDSIVADIQDFDAVSKAMLGMDAVIHLAANPDPKQSWHEVYTGGISGTYNIFEAARLAGIQKMIYASTAHILGFRELEKNQEVSPEDRISPDSFYAVGKVCGEALGQVFSDRYGMSIICLRIGYFTDKIHKSWLNKMLRSGYISPRDLAQLVQKSLETENLGFQVFYGVSANTKRMWDIRNAETRVGYQPQDDADRWLPRMERRQQLLKIVANKIRQLDIPKNPEIEYINVLMAAFQNAVKQVGGYTDRFYCIAGQTLCLRFAGTALIPYVTAFSHLEISPILDPDLTVHLWDEESTHIPIPVPPWSVKVDDSLTVPQTHLLEATGTVVMVNGDRIRAGFYPETQNVILLARDRNLAFYCLKDVRQLPYFEPGSPLRLILHWWLNDRSMQMVHAAAVGTPEGGVLLVGKGGSGKSTSALACLDSELFYAGDDYCAIANHPVPYIYSLYHTAKLKSRIDFQQRFPQLLSKVSNFDRLETEKAILFLNEYYPKKIISGFPLRSILMPRVTGCDRTQLHRASAMQMLRAIAPSTLIQLAGTSQSNLTFLADLVKQVPCYILEVGKNIETIPNVILELLANEQ
jgi:NAD dependent epimerase/dehydratase family